jgi:PPM family protein phosphatase
MTAKVQFGVGTDPGQVRQNNEDSYGVAPEMNLFVLSDGMGGLDHGEVASRMAVDTILGFCRKHAENGSEPGAGAQIEGVSAETNRLASAIREANRAIHLLAQQNGTRQMGATIAAVQFVDNRMSIAHVGDSRVYRLRGGHLDQLTRDHSYVAEQVRHGRMTSEEADASALQNVLMRALGIEDEVDVDVAEESIAEADTILLCSDGLTRELSDTQIAAVLSESKDPQRAANELTRLANDAGGGDNITVIVVRPSRSRDGFLGRTTGWMRKMGLQ